MVTQYNEGPVIRGERRTCFHKFLYATSISLRRTTFNDVDYTIPRTDTLSESPRFAPVSWGSYSSMDRKRIYWLLFHYSIGTEARNSLCQKECTPNFQYDI